MESQLETQPIWLNLLIEDPSSGVYRDIAQGQCQSLHRPSELIKSIVLGYPKTKADDWEVLEDWEGKRRKVLDLSRTSLTVSFAP